MRTIYASDQPLLELELERANEEHEDDRAGTAELLSAIEVFTAGWLHPLSIGLQFVQCDPGEAFAEVGRPRAAHQWLRERDVPEGVLVREGFSHSMVEEVSGIDAAGVNATVARGLAQEAPAGAVTTLAELKWTTVRALAPTAEPIALEVAELPVATVVQLVDGQAWFVGPTAGTAGPPARLRAVNDHYATRLQLDVFWDLWIGDADGRALIEAGVQRVLARGGWTRTGG